MTIFLFCMYPTCFAFLFFLFFFFLKRPHKKSHIYTYRDDLFTFSVVFCFLSLLSLIFHLSLYISIYALNQHICLVFFHFVFYMFLFFFKLFPRIPPKSRRFFFFVFHVQFTVHKYFHLCFCYKRKKKSAVYFCQTHQVKTQR